MHDLLASRERSCGRMGRHDPGRPVQSQDMPAAPACGFDDRAALKSISEEMAPGSRASGYSAVTRPGSSLRSCGQRPAASRSPTSRRHAGEQFTQARTFLIWLDEHDRALSTCGQAYIDS